MKIEDVFNEQTRSYVIAEIGHNHQGSLELAKKMISVAHACGADAVKLQKRDNMSLFTESFYSKPYENPNSFGTTYGEHRQHLEFGRDEYLELLDFSKKLGVDFFATAFDVPSFRFLDDLGVGAFKIASGDLTNTPLIREVLKARKPIFISTGGGTIEDVERAVGIIRKSQGRACLMQCTAGYPPAWDELNLNVIRVFKERYPDLTIGFSSHDNGIAMCVAGYVLGARVFEKHFTLDRTMKGTDHAFSLEPQGLEKLCRDLRRVESAMGDGIKRTFPSEVAPLHKMSKSIVASRRIAKGELLGFNNLEFRSPGGTGLPPYAIDNILGIQAWRDFDYHEPIENNGIL